VLVVLGGRGSDAAAQQAPATPAAVSPARPTEERATPSAAERETARSAMDEGDRLREGGDLTTALVRYKAAHEIMNVPTTGIEVARAQAELGQLVEARTTAIETANLPAGRKEPGVFREARQAAAQLAAALEPRVPSLTTVVTPADVPYVLEIDGVKLPDPARGVPFKTNPGEHVVMVSAPGYEPVREAVTLTESEARTLSVALVLRPLAPTAAAVASAATVPDDLTTDPASGPRLRGFISLGIGGALLGVGTVTGILSLSATSDAKTECRQALCPPSVERTLDRANTLANVANITVPLGVLGIAYGVYELLTLPSAATAESGPELGLQLSPRGAHATWRGHL